MWADAGSYVWSIAMSEMSEKARKDDRHKWHDSHHDASERANRFVARHD